MKLYAGTTEQFRADAQMHRIAEKLTAEYTTQLGHKPPASEVHAWQNSLMALSMLVDQVQLNDHGVILEYQLGNTSRRLDAMLTEDGMGILTLQVGAEHVVAISDRIDDLARAMR